MSQQQINFANNQAVSALLPNGQRVFGVFVGVALDGSGVVQIQSKNSFLPVGYLCPFSMQYISAQQPKAREVVPRPKASGGPAPAPALSAEVVEAQAKTPSATPVPTRAPAKALSAEAVEALEKGAVASFVLRAAHAAARENLETLMKADHGQIELRVSCPAFVIVDVLGKPQRSCSQFALAKNTSKVRDDLSEKLGYVPQGTYIRFTWEFERDERGKLVDKEGLVKVYLRWGAAKKDLSKEE